MVAGHLNVPRLRQANATRACNSNMQNGKMNEVWRVQVKMKTQGNAAKCKHDSRTCVGDIRNLTANLRLKLTCKGNSECSVSFAREKRMRKHTRSVQGPDTRGKMKSWWSTHTPCRELKAKSNVHRTNVKTHEKDMPATLCKIDYAKLQKRARMRSSINTTYVNRSWPSAFAHGAHLTTTTD